MSQNACSSHFHQISTHLIKNTIYETAVVHTTNCINRNTFCSKTNLRELSCTAIIRSSRLLIRTTAWGLPYSATCSHGDNVGTWRTIVIFWLQTARVTLTHFSRTKRASQMASKTPFCYPLPIENTRREKNTPWRGGPGGVNDSCGHYHDSTLPDSWIYESYKILKSFSQRESLVLELFQAKMLSRNHLLLPLVRSFVSKTDRTIRTVSKPRVVYFLNGKKKLTEEEHRKLSSNGWMPLVLLCLGMRLTLWLRHK